MAIERKTALYGNSYSPTTSEQSIIYCVSTEIIVHYIVVSKAISLMIYHVPHSYVPLLSVIQD
jgi:hypothetical protein